MDKNLDTTQLKKLTTIYEQSKGYAYNSDLDANNHILKFAGKLRAKLVVLGSFSFPTVHVEKALPAIVNHLQSDSSLSSVIDFVCTSRVSKQTREKLTAICEENGLEINVVDIEDLCEVDEVKKDIERNDDVVKYEKMAFDYLSKSNDSSFIKNGLFYSQILFEIFQNSGLTVDTLQQ